MTDVEITPPSAGSEDFTAMRAHLRKTLRRPSGPRRSVWCDPEKPFSLSRMYDDAQGVRSSKRRVARRGAVRHSKAHEADFDIVDRRAPPRERDLDAVLDEISAALG